MSFGRWLGILCLAWGGCRGTLSPNLTAPPTDASLQRSLAASDAGIPVRLPETTPRGGAPTEDAMSGAVQHVSYHQPAAPMPPVAAPERDEILPLPVRTAQRPVWKLDPSTQMPLRALALRDVSESVLVAFPALEALRAESLIAEGKQVAAWGEFDLKLKTENYAAPLGFYENYRNLIKLEQGVLPNGGNVYGQYRIGDGLIQPWYGERETNEGGEFKAGLLLPLLRDRALDQRRADIILATLRRQQVDPMVQSAVLAFNLAATSAYWSWVAAGLSYDVQHELLRVTIERNRVYEERVRQNDLAAIELVQNRRLIASREAKIIEAERKLQQASLKLAIFLRDGAGQPLPPPPKLLPDAFPEPQPPDDDLLADSIAAALQQRPELRELALQLEQAETDLALGQNQRLPSVNATVEASKDVGAPASSKGDKTPFELEAGVLVDVPLQRRKADGKIREAEGKLAQLAAKQRFAENKIELEVRDALSALATSYDRLLRARESLALARELEKAERERFDAGESDLLRVALQEGAAIEAALTEIEALTDYFQARAAFDAAVARDPLTVAE